MSVTWIEASAGTGKTYTLVQKVLELVRRGLGVEQILLVTFTDKATAELKTRVREGLREGWKASEEPLFARALENLSSLTITTIHGFCRALLTQFPLESGVAFEPEIVDQSTQWRRLLRDEVRPRLASLDPQLLGWAGLELEEDLLVLARKALERNLFALPLRHPDTGEQARFDALRTDLEGKTGPFWEALAPLTNGELFPEGLPADSRQAFGPEVERVLHARNHETPYGLVRNLAAARSWRELVPLLAEKSLVALERWDEGGTAWKKAATPPFSPRLEAVRSAALAFTSAARAWESSLPPGTGLAAFLRGAARQRVLESVCRPVLNRRSARELTFHDLIDRVHSLVTSEAGAPLVAGATERWKAVLIDEFQDTDPEQWSIFSALFLGPASELVLVGDPKQSIYRFRGADLDLYRAVRHQVQALGAKAQVLDQNFRSTAAMIEAVNRRFDPAAGAGWDHPEDFTPSVKGPKPIGQLVRRQGDGTLVPVPPLSPWSGADERTWHRHLVETALGLLDGASFLDDGVQPPVPLDPGDLLVLVRKKREAWRLHRLFTARGLPAVVGGAGGLLKTREAQEILLFLKALEAPRSLSAAQALGWTRLFAGATVDALAPALEAAQPDHSSGAYLGAFRRVAAALQPGVVDGGGLEHLLSRPGGRRIVTNAEHILELVQERYHQGDVVPGKAALGLETWIQGELQEDEVDLRRDGEARTIRLMTIHAAKGLEAPVVFHGFPSPASKNHHDAWIVADGVDFLLTGQSRAEEQKNQAAEDLRLTYVAWTRARAHQVFLAEGTDAPPVPQPSQGSGRRWTGTVGHSEVPVLGPGIPGLDGRHPWVESHSGLWRRATRDEAENKTVWDRPRVDRESELEPTEPSLAEALPAGPAFGDLVHDILEVTDFRGWAPDADRDRQSLVDSGIEEHCQRHRGEFQGRDLSRQLIPWLRGLFSLPLALGPDVRPVFFPDLAPEDTRREMEFHLPLKNSSAETFLWGPREFQVHAGYLTGRIDLLFRWEGRLYLADWKTNRLGVHQSPEELMTEAGYDLQAQWYWEALTRLCQIQGESLVPGGVLYVFLRGPDDRPRGVFLSPEHLTETRTLKRFVWEAPRG